MANKLNLQTITKRFGAAYDRAAKAEEAKEKQKQKFFQAINQELEDYVRKQILVTYGGNDPIEHVKRFYPGWRFIKKSELAEEILIEEDPQFMKFSYLNSDTGMVYGRTVAQNTPSLDDEKLRQEEPELWESITQWPEPWYSLVSEFLFGFLDMGDEFYDAIKGDPNYEHLIDDPVGEFFKSKNFMRILKNPDEWTSEQFDKIQQYMVPGQLSVRLVKPRPATQEELEEL